MTLEDAIKHAAEVAESKRRQAENGDWENGSMTERDCLECAEEHKQLAEWLKELKQLREQTKWILVSERLPEDRDWYLGIFKESDTGWINPIPFICYYVGKETKATTKDYWILRGLTDEDDCVEYYYNLECVAWMPLPEPYKVESEDKDET